MKLGLKLSPLILPLLISCGGGGGDSSVHKNTQEEVNGGVLNGEWKGSFYHQHDGYAGIKLTVDGNDITKVVNYLGVDAEPVIDDGVVGVIFTQGETFKAELNNGGRIDYVSINNQYMLGVTGDSYNGYLVSVSQKNASEEFGDFNAEDLDGTWKGKDYFYEDGKLKSLPFTITCNSEFDCIGSINNGELSAYLTNYNEVYGAYSGLVSSENIGNTGDFKLVLSLDKKVMGIMACFDNGCEFAYGVKQ